MLSRIKIAVFLYFGSFSKGYFSHANKK